MDEENPKWLDADYDDSHKAEVEPLFGTGTVSLQDATDDDDDIESNFGSKAGKYGAISSQEGDNDDESGAQESTVITAISSASSKSAAKKGKKNTKVRQIVITESGKPEMPRPNCFLAFFNLLEGLAMITCLALMASQIIPFIVVPFEELGWANACLKVYISLFCVLFVLVEWDMPIGFLRDASFLQTYFSRGFLYSFIGLSSLEEAYSERVADMIAHAKDQFHVSWVSLFMQISAWSLLGIGVIYMSFGVCCLKALRDKLRKGHEEKWETYREAMRIYKRENP